MILVLMMVSSFAFADDFNRLYVEAGTASSFLQSNWNKYQENYHPNYAFDDNPATAWVEGVEGSGENESLEWEVSALESASEVELEIFNGYQKSKHLLAANGAVKDVEFTVFGKKALFNTPLRATLENKMGSQKIKINLPENHGLSKIKMKIISTWPGKTYKDTCVSDIKVLVKSKVPYIPGVEKEKESKLKDWINERLSAAKFFAQQPSSYPFSATSFQSVENKNFYPESMREYMNSPEYIFYKGDTPEAFPRKELLKVIDELIIKGASLEEKKGWQKLAMKASPEEYLPDGIQDNYFEHTQMKFFSPDKLTFFEANSPILSETKEKEYGHPKSHLISNFQVKKEKGEIKLISWVENNKGMERGPYDFTTVRIMAYDKGKLRWFIHSDNNLTELKVGYHFLYDQAGKVSEVLGLYRTNGDYEEAPFSYIRKVPNKVELVKK